MLRVGGDRPLLGVRVMTMLAVRDERVEQETCVERCEFGLCANDATESVRVEDCRGGYVGVALVCWPHARFY